MEKPKPKQLTMSFEGPAITLPGDGHNPDRVEFSKPERWFPLLAGKMRKVYGPYDSATCGGCSNYRGRTGGCSALAEGQVKQHWDPACPACGCFNLKEADNRRHLRFMLMDKRARG